MPARENQGLVAWQGGVGVRRTDAGGGWAGGGCPREGGCPQTETVQTAL